MMKIAVIGLGNMGQAIVQGWLDKNVVSPEQISATANNWARLQQNCEALQITPLSNNEQAAMQADVILLAVKPYMIAEVVSSWDLLALKEKMIISIAAGMPFEKIEALLPDTHHISVIPNTPIAIGQGICVAEKKNSLTPEQLECFHQLFDPISLVVDVDTAHLSIAGTIAGCAPAFTAMYMEALGDAGVKYGLTRPVAYELAAKMIEGVGALYLAQHNHPGAMKDAVCSPAGTTIKGVSALEKNGFRGDIIDAIDAIEG